MDLNGMLTDMLKDKAINAIADKTGLDSDSAKSMTAKALPLLLSALKKNSEDPEKWESLEKAVSWNDGSILNNLWDVDLKDWSKILWHIFWDKKADVEKEIWNSNILSALAPMVMGALWKANSDSGSKTSDLLSNDWAVMKMANSFLDKDWDGDIKDDLLWMAMWFLKGKK